MPDILTTTAAGVNNDLQTYFSKKLQIQAQFSTVLDQFGYIEKIPAASSKTIQFTKYADLAISTTSLTEGVAPDSIALSTSAITAVIDQLGSVIKLTDLAELTPKHPVVQKTLELLGTQAARTRDAKIEAVLAAGTNIFYAGARASRATVVAGDIITVNDIGRVVANLRTNGAQPMADGNFVAVISPVTEMNLLKDTRFSDASIRTGQGTKGEQYKGEIASFMGVRFVRSNTVPTLLSGGTPSIALHATYIFGKDAYAVTDLQTLTSYREGPGGVTDPLHQIMTLGWKVGFKSVILNNAFMARLENAAV